MQIKCSKWDDLEIGRIIKQHTFRRYNNNIIQRVRWGHQYQAVSITNKTFLIIYKSILFISKATEFPWKTNYWLATNGKAINLSTNFMACMCVVVSIILDWHAWFGHFKLFIEILTTKFGHAHRQAKAWNDHEIPRKKICSIGNNVE